jgi:hypothetical protein
MADSAIRTDFLPQWTNRVLTNPGGRDPLGLSRVGQRLTDLLLPGIITQTDRARYYAIYCWILWHIQREEKPESWPIFASAFQRREAAVALSTMIVDENASPVGKLVIRRRLAQARETKQISTEFQVLPSNPLGGFGQYYSGCLYQLRLTQRLEDGIDRVTDGIAVQLALAVNQNVAGTPYLRQKLFTKASVELRALERSSERLGLDAISYPFAAEERKLLIDLFFGFHEARPGEETFQRRTSLGRILATVEAYDKAGIAIHGVSLEKQLLYAPTYFGVLVDSRNRTKKFKLPHFIVRCSEFWRQFCLHEFLTQALEGVLDAVLQVLEPEPRGLTLERTINELLSGDFSGYFATLVGRRCESPRGLLNKLGITGIPNEATSTLLRDRYRYNQALSEWVCERPAATPAELTARSCLLLAILYGKWRGVTKDVTYATVMELASSELAVPTFIPFIDSWFETDCSWNKALESLVTVIVRQHDTVMYGKGRLESCWLYIEEDRLVRDQDYQPYFRSSRHEQAVQIMVDLALLKWTGASNTERLTITAQGRRVLERVVSLNK